MSQAELLASLGGVVAESKTVNSEFLQFSGREGRYSIFNGAGADTTDYPTGSKVYFNIFESRKGYTCWKDSKPIDKVDYPLIGADLPPESALEDHGPYKTDGDNREGWKQHITAFVKDVETGKQYQLGLSSPSAIRAFGKFVSDIIEQGALHDLQAETPIVALGVESFKSNGFKNYKPSFTIVEWAANPSGTPAVAAEASEAPALEDQSEAAAKKKAMPASRKK
jgi:hypothetical protein